MSDVAKVKIYNGSNVRTATVYVPSPVKTIRVRVPGPKGDKGADGVGADASVIGETPSGAINGSNAIFTTAFEFIPESVAVYVNGLNQKRIAEFNTSGTTQITLTESPGVGEIVLVNYLKGA